MSAEEPKICKKCSHCIEVILKNHKLLPSYLCSREEKSEVDLVTGKVSRRNLKDCKEERLISAPGNYCGPTGRFFVYGGFPKRVNEDDL